jgi:PAS domain S-box-containing protein
MAALVCAALIATAASGVVWTYSHLAQGLVGAEFRRQRVTLASLASQLNAGVEGLRQDVVFLTALPPIAGILQARLGGGSAPLGAPGEAWWRSRLADIFSAKLRVEPRYCRIRLIDAQSGRELVRVDRQLEQVERVPDQRLEERTSRPYFQNTLQLPAGAVHLAEPELNGEDDSGPLAGIPVLRAATPVYDGTGRLFGLLVIDQDLRPRLAHLRETLADRYTLYVFNEAGEFLVHPDPARTFGSQRGKPWSVGDEFPLLWPPSPQHETDQTIVDRPGTNQTVVTGCHKLHYDPEHPQRYYGLLIASDYQAVIAPSLAVRNQAVLFGSFLTAVTIGAVLVFSRRLTRPLRRMTDAVEAFARGQTDFELPLEAHDEAGVLARAFNTLFHRVLENDAALRAEVGERRRAEEAQRESEQQLRLALDAAKAGVWVWDAAGRGSWDSAMEELFGLEAGTFDGTLQSWSRLVHRDDWPGVEAALRRSLQQGGAFRVDLRARLASGEPRDLKLHATVVRKDRTRPLRLVGVCWDITDEKLAQKRIQHYASQLERKNQEMEQFVYSVSHDLKAPLVTCKGFLGILREELREGNTEQALGVMQRVERAAQQMTRLIEDLLQFSRVGRVTNNPEVLETSAVAREIAEELRQQRGAADVRIDIQDEMPVIVADPMAVSRLFQNLLANALKYGVGGPQPRIEVGGHVADGEVRFFVRDNGAGIPQEFQRRIFGLFQRLDTTQEGTGIGLAIVSKIMTLHGGRVWVESDDQQGATFWLGFPLRFLSAPLAALTRNSA